MNVKTLRPLLNVEDVSRSIRFYRDRLGFDVVFESEADGRIRFASLRNSGIELLLNEPGEVDSRDRRHRGTYADAVLYFTVADVDALHAQLREAGFPVSELEDEAYGLREFTVRDPDGYELAFGAPLTVEAA
jgi:uncharacterized glyoxalase superfamily protein PhnB